MGRKVAARISAAAFEIGVLRRLGDTGVFVFDDIWPFVADPGLREVAALMAGDPPAVEDVDGW